MSSRSCGGTSFPRQGRPSTGTMTTVPCAGTVVPSQCSLTPAEGPRSLHKGPSPSRTKECLLDRSRRPTPRDSPHAHKDDCPLRRDRRPVAMFTPTCGGTAFPPQRGLTSRKRAAIPGSRPPSPGVGLAHRCGDRASRAYASSWPTRPPFVAGAGKTLAKTRHVRRRAGRAALPGGRGCGRFR